MENLNLYHKIMELTDGLNNSERYTLAENILHALTADWNFKHPNDQRRLEIKSINLTN